MLIQSGNIKLNINTITEVTPDMIENKIYFKAPGISNGVINVTGNFIKTYENIKKIVYADKIKRENEQQKKIKADIRKKVKEIYSKLDAEGKKKVRAERKKPKKINRVFHSVKVKNLTTGQNYESITECVSILGTNRVTFLRHLRERGHYKNEKFEIIRTNRSEKNIMTAEEWIGK